MHLSTKTRQAIDAALHLIKEEDPCYAIKGEKMSSSKIAKMFFQLRLSGEPAEHFEVAYLDSQHRLIQAIRMFSGTLDRATVYPREIIKKCVELNAAAVILAHNHPSGHLLISESDKIITRELSQVLGLLNVAIIDHIIVGKGTCSFAERGESL